MGKKLIFKIILKFHNIILKQLEEIEKSEDKILIEKFGIHYKKYIHYIRKLN